jgi:hypothetical protein
MRRAGPIGRITRLVAGGFLVIVVTPSMARASVPLLLSVLAIVIALAAFYAIVHLLVSRKLRNLNKWLGAGVANAPAILVFVLGAPEGLILGSGEGQLAAAAYVGVALLVAAIQADLGCEVMSVPGLLFGRQTHLACIAFSPIDWLEKKLSE